MTPTLATYNALQSAFDHFNSELFGGELPQCLMTLRSSSRVNGFMHQRRFVSLTGQQVSELGINPGYFALQSLEEVMSTVVHEMVHHWQNHFGTPSKSMPHNQEWADKMQSIGLMPSHSGFPGGKRTGRSMSDYILPDGPFIRASRQLSDAGFALPWFDSHVPMSPAQMQIRRSALAATGDATVGGIAPIEMAMMQGVQLSVAAPVVVASTPKKERFVCSQCGIMAWAAPDTALECGACRVSLVPAKKVRSKYPA